MTLQEKHKQLQDIDYNNNQQSPIVKKRSLQLLKIAEFLETTHKQTHKQIRQLKVMTTHAIQQQTKQLKKTTTKMTIYLLTLSNYVAIFQVHNNNNNNDC